MFWYQCVNQCPDNYILLVSLSDSAYVFLCSMLGNVEWKFQILNIVIEMHKMKDIISRKYEHTRASDLF